MKQLTLILSLLCGIWFAIMCGFFFAFSAVVMPGLALPDGSVGLQAMQAINRAVANPLFAAGFWGALSLAIAGGACALVARGPGWPFLLCGCLVYVVGVFVTTGTGNVPLNRALGGVVVNASDAVTRWQAFQLQWTQLNNVRMASAFVAAIAVLGCFVRPQK